MAGRRESGCVSEETYRLPSFRTPATRSMRMIDWTFWRSDVAQMR